MANDYWSSHLVLYTLVILYFLKNENTGTFCHFLYISSRYQMRCSLCSDQSLINRRLRVIWPVTAKQGGMHDRGVTSCHIVVLAHPSDEGCSVVLQKLVASYFLIPTRISVWYCNEGTQTLLLQNNIQVVGWSS